MDKIDIKNTISPCILKEESKKDREYEIVKLCNTILNKLFIWSKEKEKY